MAKVIKLENLKTKRKRLRKEASNDSIFRTHYRSSWNFVKKGSWKLYCGNSLSYYYLQNNSGTLELVEDGEVTLSYDLSEYDKSNWKHINSGLMDVGLPSISYYDFVGLKDPSECEIMFSNVKDIEDKIKEINNNPNSLKPLLVEVFKKYVEGNKILDTELVKKSNGYFTMEVSRNSKPLEIRVFVMDYPYYNFNVEEDANACYVLVGINSNIKGEEDEVKNSIFINPDGYAFFTSFQTKSRQQEPKGKPIPNFNL